MDAPEEEGEASTAAVTAATPAIAISASADPHVGSINSGWKQEMPASASPAVASQSPSLRKKLSVEELMDPLGLFTLFLTDKMVIDIAKQTNLYQSQLAVESAAEHG